MAKGGQFANKCRACQKTIDVGVAAWFNKDAALGQKNTCVACHQLHLDMDPDAAAEIAEQAAADAKLARTISKKRRTLPKVTAELLLDKEKGLQAVYKNFPKLKFKGKGHETADLRRLLNKYAEWAHILLPEMEFADFTTKLEKVSGNWRVRSKLELLRNVAQGLCGLDDMEDYDLADRGTGGTFGMEMGDDWGGGNDEFDDYDPEPVPEVDDEARARAERNKQAALAKAAARRAAAAALEPDEGAEWEREQMVAANSAGAGGGISAFDEEAEAEGFGAFDEEAEMEMGFDDFTEHTPAPPEGAEAAAAEAEAEAMEAMAAEAEAAAEAAAATEAAAEEETEEKAAARARAAAQSAAEALEMGLDDDDEF